MRGEGLELDPHPLEIVPMRASCASLLFALLFVSPTSADDGILGLPTPRDPRNQGAVLLFGGGGITNDAWDRFIELAGGPRARIVIVPSAGYRSGDYNSDKEFRADLSSRFGAWLRLQRNGRVASVEFLYTDNPKDAEDEAFVRPLRTATGVWFSGGKQSRLYYRYVGNYPARTKFQNALREVIERGGIVGGTSAGMAALPEIMTLSQDASHGPVTAVPSHGLGLFTNAIVDQHFEARNGRLERSTGLLRDDERLDKLRGVPGSGARMVGLAVETNTGLVLRGDRLEVLGDGNAHVFLKTASSTLTWHTLKPGTRVELRRELSGQVTLVK
jgi:cyanophycinase